jgi:hypothetical protein
VIYAWISKTHTPYLLKKPPYLFIINDKSQYLLYTYDRCSVLIFHDFSCLLLHLISPWNQSDNNRYSYTDFTPKNRKSNLSGLPSAVTAPIGFQSKDQVMQLFEYLFTYQSDKKSKIDENKILLATARASRKKAAELEKSQGILAFIFFVSIV